VAKKYGEQFQAKGGSVMLGFEVGEFREGSDPARPVEIIGKARGQVVSAGHVLTCAGLQSDRVAHMSGCLPEPRIVPFRGEFLLLCDEKAAKIRGNIYPVPDPRFPFLGVHFTPSMNGQVSTH
jgi:2-hydroxyglutarate dehydrogenase